MKRILFALLFTSVFCFAQEEEKLNGLVKHTYADDSPYCETTYVDGVMHGPYIAYYSNGQVDWEGAIVNGVKEGVWKNFREDGTQRFEGPYENDEQVGTWKHFDENGKQIPPEEIPKSPEFLWYSCDKAY